MSPIEMIECIHNAEGELAKLGARTDRDWQARSVIDWTRKGLAGEARLVVLGRALVLLEAGASNDAVSEMLNHAEITVRLGASVETLRLALDDECPARRDD